MGAELYSTNIQIQSKTLLCLHNVFINELVYALV